ncbi:MAG: AMP-binding protein, partial [Dehalococcoidia bacterium]
MARGAARHPDEQIVFAAVGKTQLATLASLHDRAMALAAAMHEAGVAPGAAVGVQAPVDGAITELLEALWLLGAVVVPLVTAGPADIAHVTGETDIAHLVVAASWRGQELAASTVEHQRD